MLLPNIEKLQTWKRQRPRGRQQRNTWAACAVVLRPVMELMFV